MQSVLPKNTTQCPRSGLEPRPLTSESSALTMRPPHLHSSYRKRGNMMSFILFQEMASYYPYCTPVCFRFRNLLSLCQFVHFLAFNGLLYRNGVNMMSFILFQEPNRVASYCAYCTLACFRFRTFFFSDFSLRGVSRPRDVARPI